MSSAPRPGALVACGLTHPMGASAQNAPLCLLHFLCPPLSHGALPKNPQFLSVASSQRPDPRDSHDSGSPKEPCMALPDLLTPVNLSSPLGCLSPDLPEQAHWPCSPACSPSKMNTSLKIEPSPFPGRLPPPPARMSHPSSAPTAASPQRVSWLL